MACERCRGSSIVVVDHLETCSDGVSSIMWYSEEPCERCGGRGYVQDLEEMGDGSPGYTWTEWIDVPCPVCSGTEQPEWPEPDDEEEPPEEKGDAWTDFFAPYENATPTSVTCFESETRSTAPIVST